MEAKLQKWGNSSGIRIPKNMLESLGIKPNDILHLEENDNKIIIYKPLKKHVSLKERVEKYEKLPNNKKGKVEPYDWGEDVGLEIWE